MKKKKLYNISESRQYASTHYEENKEKLRRRALEYYYSHREDILQRQRENKNGVRGYKEDRVNCSISVPHSPRMIKIFKCKLYDTGSCVIENVVRLRKDGRTKMANWMSNECLANATVLAFGASSHPRILTSLVEQ
jgi:hypothetical protein